MRPELAYPLATRAQVGLTPEPEKFVPTDDQPYPPFVMAALEGAAKHSDRPLDRVLIKFITPPINHSTLDTRVLTVKSHETLVPKAKEPIPNGKIMDVLIDTIVEIEEDIRSMPDDEKGDIAAQLGPQNLQTIVKEDERRTGALPPSPPRRAGRIPPEQQKAAIAAAALPLTTMQERTDLEALRNARAANKDFLRRQIASKRQPPQRTEPSGKYRGARYLGIRHFDSRRSAVQEILQSPLNGKRRELVRAHMGHDFPQGDATERVVTFTRVSKRKELQSLAS